MNAKLSEQSISAAEGYTTASVTARDGVAIGYRQLGQGPGVVLLHGSMSSSANHMQLAQALADAFTVYVPDRRGRGLSGPFSEEYGIQNEIEDLDALLTKTGAHYLFGLSSGGLVALEAALTLPAVHKAAIYEPALFIDDSETPAAVLARFDRQMAQGKVAAALITGMKGGQFGPPIFLRMPDWLLERLVRLAMKSEEKKGTNGYVPMRDLAPTLHYDFQLVADMNGKQDRYSDVTADVLLLGGSKSPAYLKVALDALETILPRVERVEFPGLDHAASWNADLGGRPEVVAQELRRFFAG